MDSRWIGIIIFLLVIITAVSFLRPRSGERPGPNVGELRVLEIDEDRTVRIMGRLLRDHRQAYYYQVEQGGEVIAEPAFFGSLPPGSPMLTFQWYEMDDKSLVGFAVEHRPSEVLFLYDFDTGESWPAHEGGESVAVFQARGHAMFEPLAAAHPEAGLTLRHAEGLRPLPHPPGSPYLDDDADD
ncbi:hypothetical protein ACERK3_08390 [Phycisphaerales bacterium AB-hyl4]|uniref:DUF192 domain-containing protein n=1 Tax=Natronomicrosphaera hydrolytica TaxID=3242702 RepID=A0ABV4U7R4_9BACT